MSKPDILFIMTDQQRFDTIAALGNQHIYTPNLDRLVRRGLTFNNAYSTCPVCVPARYTIRTGCEPPTLRIFNNMASEPAQGQAATIEERCGPYLPETMKEHGYRTFGIGKFHSQPWDEDLGYDVHLHSEELYNTPDQRKRDSYAAWLRKNHPEYNHLEMLMGERGEMYYMPQMSPQPAECGVEGWAAQRAVEQIAVSGSKPYFGMVSFIGPHPPFAPPLPFNRMYDPDRMPDPVKGDLDTDHMDTFLPLMNHLTWSESFDDQHARILKARYYGEISYIDTCIGKILDAVESKEEADNTVICFFSDHGDHMGDHHAWQKESFFEASTHIPFLVSWPARLARNQRRDELVCLTDLFGLATGAAGSPEIREGVDLLGVIEGSSAPRRAVTGLHGLPGSRAFKIMVRDDRWKYIFFANGGRQQLFDLKNDPGELCNRAGTCRDMASALRKTAVKECRHPGAADALDGDDLKEFPLKEMKWEGNRMYQFDRSRGITKFPDHPSDVLKEYDNPWLK